MENRGQVCLEINKLAIATSNQTQSTCANAGCCQRAAASKRHRGQCDGGVEVEGVRETSVQGSHILSCEWDR